LRQIETSPKGVGAREMEHRNTGTPTELMLKQIHLVATVWFVACAGYLVSIGLRRAGFNWWLVLSLSGYSTSMLLLLVCLYLFAFVHGVRGMRRTRAEHPVTGAGYYMFLYVSTPLLAGLCAATEIDVASRTNRHLIYIATVTLKATFLAWIVIDPLVGFIEMNLPASRSHRTITKK
jgi:hypothetical protein